MATVGSSVAQASPISHVGTSSSVSHDVSIVLPGYLQKRDSTNVPSLEDVVTGSEFKRIVVPAPACTRGECGVLPLSQASFL